MTLLERIMVNTMLKNVKFEELKVAELKDLCRKEGIVGYSKLRKAELIAVLEEKVNSKKQALKEAKANAQEELGQDFGRALTFWKNLKNIKRMSIQDYADMTESWTVLTTLVDEDNTGSTMDTAVALAELFAPGTDVTKYDVNELNDFITECIGIFVAHTTTERLKKDNMTIIKMSMEDLEVDNNNTFIFDSSKASTFTGEKVVIGETAKMRLVGTSEDGISRMLQEKGLSSVTMFIGLQSQTPEEQIIIDAQKAKLFTEGFTDVSTGKHYMPAFQNPSSVRQANMMFVEAKNWDDIMQLWLEITGLNTWENFSKAFFDKEGKVVLAKLLARVSCRGSNSFDTSKISEKWSDEIKKARVYYVEDPEEEIVRDYKTLDRPGHLEMITGKARPVTPGDGQGEASYCECALFAVNMRIFSEDEYEEFMRLWNGVDMDETKVREGSRLDKLIKKMPLVYQIRHGEKKGILVRVNLERFEATKDIDIIIPDSVRKFIGGEWKDYPLEICNYLKRKDKYVSMNAQFIQALHYENPNELNTVIIDKWFDVLKESLTDIAKAQMFHGIIRSTDTEDAGVASTLVQALRTSSDLINESQVCNWRKDQYRKFINNMKIGRILVPGMYSYEICDPYSLLNKWFGLDIPCLAEGEFYHNGLTCECGLFRSPLIAPFEATKVQLVEHDTYRYMRDVIIFNTEDGVWDRLGGSDFDGDQCAIVPDNTEAGHVIVSGIRTINYDVWEKAQTAKKVEFTIPNLIEHLVKTAMRDRTGLITNYATNAQDIANHLRASIHFAKLLGCEAITMLHPSAFSGCADDVLGNHYIPRTATQNGKKVFQIRGLVLSKWNNQLKRFEFDENGIYGTFAFDQIEEIAKKYEIIVEYLRILQGREIDGAKTGVYAEGVSGEDFVDMVKVVFTPHNMMTRKEILGKPVANSSILNAYVSLSPLGRIHDYVCKREHEIFDILENGSNKIFLLQSLMTEQEAQDMTKLFLMQDGSQKNLVDIMVLRKKVYNSKVYDIMKNLSGEEMTETLTAVKVAEENELRSMADMLNVSIETVAVASYIATYTKTSKQNEGLTYAWLLSGELLSVFARGNKKFDLFRLPLSAESVSIKTGYMYVNGKKYIPVNADDCDNVLIWRNEGRPYAHVHKKTDVVATTRQNNVVYGSQIYTMGAYGFKYHIISENPVETWKELVKANGYIFNITMDATNRAVLSTHRKEKDENGNINNVVRSIGALMTGASFDLMNKKVKLVNDMKTNPIKFNNASIENMQVVIIGESEDIDNPNDEL